MPTKGTPFKVKQAMRRREANWNLGIVAVDKKGSTQSAVFNDETSFASSQSTYDPLGAARNAAAPKFKSSTVGRLREGAARAYGAAPLPAYEGARGSRRPGQRGKEFVARKRILDARDAEERGSRPASPENGDAPSRPGTGQKRPPEFTPLMKAAAAGNDVRVESLLALPGTLVTIFATDHKGRTALDWAQVKGSTTIAETLKMAMERELRIKAQDRETKEREHELRRLVRKNLHLRAILHHAINTRDVASLNRAVHAADFSRDEFNKAVRMLKGYAARNKRPDLAEGTVLTDVAPPLEGKVNEKMKVAEVDDADLDEKLYFIDVETETGGTALLVACAAGNVLLADELLQRGAEANHENLRGHTALSWACVCGADGVVDLLLRNGADPRRPTKLEQRTPLVHAAQHGHAKVLQVLVDRLFYDAQMKRHEALRPDRPTPLPEKEARVSERHWLRDFEEAVHYVDPSSEMTALELAESVNAELAVNVLRTAEARIEQRQNELVQGDLKQAPKVCPRNCGAGMLKACDLTSHMLNDCELRPAGCDNCGGTLPKRFLLEHQATDCPARMVDCHMCGASILASSWKAHREFRCPLRTVTCRMGCGQEMPCEQLAQHELIRCRWRGLPCPLPGCGREIRAYLMRDHKKKECLRRLVKCRLGCGLQLPFEDRDKHEQEVCTQVCQWDGCGQRIGPEEHRRLHERFHCERRGVPCPYACGIPGVAANAMKVHAEFVCPQRPATCPYGCAWEGVFEDLRLHVDAERGDCPERQMRCRYDMVGRRVSWFVAAKRARARAAGRNGDDEGYERGVLRRYNPDTDEFLLFGSASKPEWVKLADLDGFSLIDTDNFKCYWVSSARMKTHLRRKCPCRPFAGRQKTADELSDSDASVEELVLEEAEPGDGGDEPVPEAEVPRWDDDAPEEEETPYDAREGVRIDPRTRDEHGVEVGTSKRCKYACGRVFPMTDLGMDEYGYHVLKLCGKRPVTCPHCGDAELWAEEFEDHPANCPVLTFEPPPPGFTCACGEYVADSDKVEHMVGCVAKECYCPQGCGVKMLQSKLEKHKKDECIRRHLRHGVLVSCRLGCGKEGIRFQDEWAHQTSECPRRVVECKLGCGSLFPFVMERDHAATCPKRMVPCGVGAQGCQRELRSWLKVHDHYNKFGDRANSFVLCDVHNAGALLYAVRTKDTLLLLHLLNAIAGDTAQIELESNDGYNALTKACGLDNIEHVEILWRAGAMINAETKRGRTPLIEAAKEGHLATCRYLVDRGAVIEYKSRQRKTAIQWASISGHAHVQRQLRRDNDVQQSMARLFTLVTCGDAAAVRDIVLPGEVYTRGALVRLQRELGAEDAALDGATAELDQLHKEMRKFAFAEREQNRNLLSKSKLAHIVDGMADDVMECRDKLDRNVADQLRKAALALKTIEAADVIELTSLKSTAVKQRVFRVLIICCELLGAKLPPPTAALANAASLSEPTSLGGDEASGLVEGTSMGTPEVRQAAQEKKHRVETWKACKKLLKTPNLLRQLRFFTDAMAPVDGAGARRLRRMYSDEYRDGSKLLSEALSMSASTMKSSKGRPETVNEDDDESHTTHLTGDSQMTKPPEYDSDGYEIPDESHLPESERTTPEDREAAKGVRRAAVRARAVADTPPFFEVEGSSNVSDASTTSSTVDGYQIVGVLALWANAHIASIEAKSCVRDLDEQERGLRARFDLSREPEMLVAKRDAYVAASRVKMIEREVEQLEKEVKHRQNRVVAWEGKVRVARVLQQYTPGGHSLLTWACCLGISSVVETLLDHGSCPGLPDVVEAEAARVVQLVYRHHVWRSAERVRVARSELADSASEKAARRKRETEFKFILQRALTVYMDKRTTHRLPLCEAAYNRNGNVFEAFERRRILYTGRHLYETALYPEPPFPFARRPPVAAHLRKRLYNVVDCVEHGMKDLGAMHWAHGRAWVSEYAADTPQALAREAATAAWEAHLAAVEAGNELRSQRVKDRDARRANLAAIAELEAALRDNNFMEIARIFDAGVVPVDHEDPRNGLTPLISAACEDTTVAARKMCFDVEGRECLAVILLLDRKKRRPRVDGENRYGHTALTMAVVKGRFDVVQALLDRGAKADRRSLNKRGWTPLRFAAERDKAKAVELLMLRGGDPYAVADDGLTPMDVARKKGFVDATAAFARGLAGHAGRAVANRRDVAVPEVPCDFGCGTFIKEDDAAARDEHRKTCRKRPVVCGECGLEGLWAEELPNHVAMYCQIAHVARCPLRCGEEFRAEDMAAHLLVCKNRVVTCEACGIEVFEAGYAVHRLKRCAERPRPVKRKPPREIPHVLCPHCGTSVREDFLDPNLHNCPVFRPTPCPNKCGELVEARDVPRHVAEDCVHRWVPCENGCGLKLRVVDMAMHLHGPGPAGSRCGLAVEACERCGQEMPSRQMPVHDAYACPRRDAGCGLCGSSVPFEELERHKKVECPVRTVLCPNRACYKYLPLNQMRHHAARTCRKRLVRCLQGCGMEMPVRRIDKHMSERCSLRHVDCPLGCGMVLRAYEEWNHIEKLCVRRFTSGLKTVDKTGGK